jgi:biotin operon repressor
MTDLIKQNQPQKNLMPYNVDGLELFFSSDRKVRASQSAIARMCGVTETTIRNDLKTLEENGTILDVIYAQGRSMTEGSRSKLHGSSTIQILLKKRNPSRLEQFSLFGIDEGLAQMAGVPLPVATPVMSTEDQLILMAENALKWAKLQKAVINNPGDKRMIETALTDTQPTAPTLDGRMTLAEMADQAGLNLDPSQSRIIGAILAGSVKCRKEEYEVAKVRRKYVGSSGKMQYTWVNNYPCSMYSSFVSACTTMRLLS